MLALVAFVSIAILALGQDEPPVAEATEEKVEIFDLGDEANVITPEWANVDQARSTVNNVGGVWVAQGPGPATNGQTENVSPNNEVVGAVHVVLAHPSNPNILYAGGTNGGVWKTTSATSNSPTWTPLTDNMPSNSIGALDFDYNDTSYQTVWAGIGKFSSYGRTGGLRTGLLKTTNGGTSWSVVNGGGTLNGKNISGLVARGNTILLAVNFADSFTYNNVGIFRSTDGGNSFSQVSVGDGSGASGLPGGLSYDIAANPNIPGVVYTVMNQTEGVGGTNGIYRSTDTGATWSKVSTPEMDSLIISASGGTSNVEIALGDSGSVFVAILNAGQLRGGGTYYSPTGDSNTFVAMDKVLVNEGGGSVGTNPRLKPQDAEPGSQGTIHFSITVDPTNDEVVYVGGDRQPRGFQDQGSFPNAIGAFNYSGRLFRGDAGIEATGAIPSPQWEHLTHTQNAGGMSGGGTASNSSPHADSRHMDFDANGNLIESDDGGVYRRTNPSNNTGDWFSINGNLQTNEQHDVAYDHIANVIMSGNQDNGSSVQSSAGSTNWVVVSGGDGGDIAIGLNPSNTSQSVRYSSAQNLGGLARRVYNSSNQLLSTNYPLLTLINGSDPMAVQFVTPVELNVIDSQRLIFGASNGIYESQDEGASINRLSSTGVVSGSGGNTMVYGGRKDGINNADFIFAALSGSQTVGVRTSASGEIIEYSTPADSSLRGVAADPDDWNRLFIIDQDQVFMSTDAGVNWTDITGDLPAGFTAVDLRVLDFVRAGSRGAVLVGGINGVYVATDNDFSSWSKIGSGLPIVPVWDMDYDRTDDVLVAGTLGRGSWSLNNVAESLFGPTVPEYLVTPVADANGSIDPGTVQTVIEGDTVSFTLIPDGGFQIKLPIEGTCGGDLSGNVYRTSPITQNCTVTASFEQVPATQYVVTPFADANGSISPSTDQTVAEGERATFTITPDSGYQIKLPVGGTCGGTLSGTTYTTNPVTQNCTVNANFELIPSTQYTVTPSAGANGSISPGTAQSVTQGATATFTITPDSGYQTKLPVGGTCGGSLSGASYTTEPVTQDCSVTATFELITGTTPPDAPTLAKIDVTESSATLQITPGAAGSDPISNYETKCSIEDLAARGALPPLDATTPVTLGYFDRSQAFKAGSNTGRTFVANASLPGLERGMVLRVEKQGGGFKDFKIDRDSTSQQGNRFAASDAADGDWIRLLIQDDGNFFGSYLIDGVVYEARVEAGQTVIYSTADGTLADNPFENDGLSPNWTEDLASQALQTGELSANPTVVTLGLLYDNVLAGQSDLVSWVDWLVTSANDIYQSSGLDLAFKVVLLNQYEPGSTLTIEERLRVVSCGTSTCGPSGVVNTTVDSARTATGADMIAQLVGVGTEGTCGVGWITPSQSCMTDSANCLYHVAYSASAYVNGNGTACPSNVLAHELGHNFSLNHDRDTLGAAPYPSTAYSYAFGHRIDSGARGSMMSYPTTGFSGYLPYLSNPNILVSGQALGVDAGQTNEAYSALAVAQVDDLYEAVFDNGSGASLLIPPAPRLDNLASSTTTIEVSFTGLRTIGLPGPALYTANCSGVTASSSAPPIIVSGLQSGTSYSCSVTASNEYGTSQPSETGVITTQSQTFTVTPSAGAGGAISPSTAQQVAQGNTTSFTVTPDSGFNIDTVTGCGGSLVGTIYTTGPVSANCTVSASFIEQSTDNATVTATAGAGGSITPSGAQLVTVGDSVSFVVTPNADYRIASVSGCGGTLSGNTYTTEAITADCSVQALFSRETWRVSGLSTTPQFDGLPTGENFACSAIASNSAGDSPPSNIVTFTTQSTSAPSVPTITNTDYGDGEIILTVSVADTGGAPIDFYTANCGGVTATSDTSVITVTGLTNDVAYSCTVTATNTLGVTSGASSSVTVTPQEVTTGGRLWLYLLGQQQNRASPP